MAEHACRRIDHTLCPVEHCVVRIYKESQALAISGPQTLKSITVDDIEAIATFDSDPSSIGQGAPLIVCCPHSADNVLLFDSLEVQQEVAEGIMQMKRDRLGVNKTAMKLIVYDLGSFDDFMLQNLGTQGSSYIRWQASDAAKVIPFPHSRLDFLNFHSNKSVMFKICWHGDRRIELSADRVSASGASFIVDSAVESSGCGTREDRQIFLDVVACALAERNIDQLLSIGQKYQNGFMDDLVLIMTDAAIYLTERTGRVIVRMQIEELARVFVVSKARDGSRLPEPVVLLADKKDYVLVFKSRYASDLIHRAHHNGSLKAHALVTFPAIAPQVQPQTRRSEIPEDRIGVAETLQRGPTVPNIRTSWTQTATASTTTQPTSPMIQVDDMDAELSDVSAMVLRDRVRELRDEIAHRDVTIGILQQRNEQLATAQERSQAESAQHTTGRPNRDQPLTPRSNKPTTPRRAPTPSSKVSKKPSASEPTATPASPDRQRQGNSKQREDEVTALRFYCVLLEEALRKERNKELEERIAELESDVLCDENEGKTLRYALREASRQQRESKERIARLTAENQELSRTTDDALAELGNRVAAECQRLAEDRVRIRNENTHAKLAQIGRPWDHILKSEEDIETKIAEEAAVRTADLAANNAALVQELRQREHQVDALGQEMMAYFAAEGKSRPDIRELLDQLLSSSSAIELLNNKSVLETKVRSLLRQIEDLKQCRAGLVEELHDVVSHAENSTSATSNDVEKLRFQLQVLQRFGSVQPMINRVAGLEIIAAKYAAAKEEMAQALKHAEEIEDEHAALVANVTSLTSEREKLKLRVAALEQQLNAMTVKCEEQSSGAKNVTERHNLEIRDLRKQIKLLRDRAQDRSATRPIFPSQRSAPQAAPHPTSSRPATDINTPRTASTVPTPRVSSTPRQHAATPVQQHMPDDRDERIQRLEEALAAVQREHPTWKKDGSDTNSARVSPPSQSRHFTLEEPQAPPFVPPLAISPATDRLHNLEEENRLLQEQMAAQRAAYEDRMRQQLQVFDQFRDPQPSAFLTIPTNVAAGRSRTSQRSAQLSPSVRTERSPPTARSSSGAQAFSPQSNVDHSRRIEAERRAAQQRVMQLTAELSQQKQQRRPTYQDRSPGSPSPFAPLQREAAAFGVVTDVQDPIALAKQRFALLKSQLERQSVTRN